MARSAARTWGLRRSASENTATASSPSSWQARMILRAISPRLATRTRFTERRGSSPTAGVARAVSELDEDAAAEKGVPATGSFVHRASFLGPGAGAAPPRDEKLGHGQAVGSQLSHRTSYPDQTNRTPGHSHGDAGIGGRRKAERTPTGDFGKHADNRSLGIYAQRLGHAAAVVRIGRVELRQYRDHRRAAAAPQDRIPHPDGLQIRPGDDDSVGGTGIDEVEDR